MFSCCSSSTKDDVAPYKPEPKKEPAKSRRDSDKKADAQAATTSAASGTAASAKPSSDPPRTDSPVASKKLAAPKPPLNEAASQKELDKYIIGNQIGSGCFAVVKHCIRKADGRAFAIKIIEKKKLSPEELAVLHDEVTILEMIHHPNVVGLQEVVDTKSKMCLIMELLSGGELFDRIVKKKSYSEVEAARVCRQVTLALQYIHSRGIVHRDLKPENLLFENNEDDSPIKIADFGLAKYVSGEQLVMTTACGTPGYVAPEVLKDEPYDQSVDLWSLGVILYILLCGFPPFYDENTTVLYNQIKAGDYTFPAQYWSEISREAKDIVSGLLTVDPKKRLTAAQLLKTPWVMGKASDRKFGTEHAHRMLVFQARKKMRQGINLVRAVNRFAIQLRAMAFDKQPGSRRNSTKVVPPNTVVEEKKEKKQQ